MIARSASLVGEVGVVLDRPAVRRTFLAVFGVVCVIMLANGSPLGWDESVYAARAKDLVESGFSWRYRSGAYWSDIRAPGLPMLLAIPFRVFGASDFVARAVVVVFAVGFLAMMGRTLDLFVARRVGTTAVLLSALCPGFIATSTLAFADIPAVFFGTAAVYALAKCYVDDDTRLLAVVPIAIGAATAIRFGAVLLVVAPLTYLGVLVAIRLVHRRNRRMLVSYALAGVASVGVVAFLLGSRLLTTSESPLAATRAYHEGRSTPSGNWIDDLSTILRPGPVDYGFDGAFWGWPYAVFFGAAATLAIVRLVVRRNVVMLVICGAISTAPILLYAVTVNQFVTTYLAPIFAIGAAMVAVGLWFVPASPAPPALPASPEPDSPEPQSEPVEVRPLRPGVRFVSRWPAAVGVLALAAVLVSSAVGVDRMHTRLFGFDQVRQGSIIADDLLGADCRLATSRVPQVAWYSDCYTGRVLGPDDLFDEASGEPPFTTQGERLGAESGEIVGLLLLEGASGEPGIDQVWDSRIEERSVILTSPAGRRVGVIAVEVP